MRNEGRWILNPSCYGKYRLGHEIYYETTERGLWSVSIRRWEEISKMLPLLVDFLNRGMKQEWGKGTVRDVRVFAGGELIRTFRLRISQCRRLSHSL